MGGLGALVRPVRVELRRRGPALVRAGRRAGRAGFLLRARAAAALADGHVTLDVHPTASIAPSTRVEVKPGSRTLVVLGPGVRVEDGVVLSLRGGELRIGAGTEVRRRTTLVVGGLLDIGSAVMLGAGLMVHCDESVVIGDLTIIAPNSTLTDSAHVRTPPGVPVQHSVTSAPLRIGSNCWLGAGAVVTAGVTIGDQSFVGAGAVVTRDVEPGWLVAGVPARPLRQLE